MFFVAFITNLKRLLKPSAAALLMIFIFAVFVAVYIQRKLEIDVSVGVYCEKASDVSSEIIESLKEFSNISVKEYDSLQKMKDDIVSVKIESGYVLDENIERYIQKGQINKAARLYKSDATVSGAFTDELMFAALLKASAPYISANYLGNKTGLSHEEILGDIKSKIDSYYKDDIFMDIDISYVGDGTETEQSPKNRIIIGIVSVYLFILFFYMTIEGIDEKKKGYYQKLSRKGQISFLGSYTAANALFCFTISLFSIYFISNHGIGYTFFAALLYILTLAAMSFIIINYVKSAHVLYAMFPIISIIVIVLGGAFFDLSSLSPLAGKVSYVFPTYYFVKFLL